MSQFVILKGWLGGNGKGGTRPLAESCSWAFKVQPIQSAKLNKINRQFHKSDEYLKAQIKY